KTKIADKHQEVIVHNSNLQEALIKQTQQEIQQLGNQLFAVKNKIENLHLQETSAAKRIADFQTQLEQNQQAISATRTELDGFNVQLKKLAEDMAVIEKDFSVAEQEYNQASSTFNEGNIQLTRHQSKVAS